MPGGTLRPHNGGIIGPAATAFVSGFRADYLVTSVGAIEHDGAMMEFDVNEAMRGENHDRSLPSHFTGGRSYEIPRLRGG